MCGLAQREMEEPSATGNALLLWRRLERKQGAAIMALRRAAWCIRRHPDWSEETLVEAAG